MSKSNFYFLCTACLIATTAFAQTTSASLTTDLDRDGRPETFILSDNGQSEVTLTIRRPGRPSIVAPSIAWSLEPASLERAPNGSLRLKTSHMGIGRAAHEQSLTIAFRNGAYQVLGITRSSWDKLDPDAATACDINLVTGRGIVNGRAVRRPALAKSVTAWTMDQDLPAGCAER